MHLLLAFFKKKPPVDVSEHIDETTLLVWLAFALLVAFFAIRPELWRRMWFRKGDPRPIALARISMGAMTLWTILDYLAFKTALFTDEGLYMTQMARSKFGGRLRNLWDPEHGFEHWYDVFDALFNKFSILHMRSDPMFVSWVFGLCIAALVCVIIGLWTRPMTVIAWLLVNNIYNYSPVSYTGGDTALRVFFFLGLFLQWGEAYSVDSWRRRRKAILSGARAIPALRQVPLWPTYIMMVQLTCIYFATGLLKSGGTWFDGSALYYALQLDHFYRFQNTAIPVIGHYLGLTQLGTFVTHYWERLFPLAVLGVMLRGWHMDYTAGAIPKASWGRRIVSWLCLVVIWTITAYFLHLGVHYYFKKGMGNIALSQAQFKNLVTALMVVLPIVTIGGYRALRSRFPGAHDFLLNWVLSKKVWIGLGLAFHAGIDALMNVGTFVQVMIAPYWVWLMGEDVEHMWRLLYWKTADVGAEPSPGSGYGVRPERPRWRLLARLVDGFSYRARPPAYRVICADDDATIRRVALLRCWDLGERFDYVIDPQMRAGVMCMQTPERGALDEREANWRLALSCPGLWWILPLAWLAPVGRLGRRMIGLPALWVGAEAPLESTSSS